MPPPANKAIRDGKDADTAAFERHSEQKRTRRRRESRTGRGLKREAGGEGSVCCGCQSERKPALCCQEGQAKEKRGTGKRRKNNKFVEKLATEIFANVAYANV